MPWWLPSLNHCHRHKLGRNSKISVSIGKPMTRWSFWALKMSKKFIPGPSYGRLKKMVAKFGTRHNYWQSPKISVAIRNRIAWILLFWALKFLKKVISSLSYRRSKFGSKSWYFLPHFYTNLSLFLAFTVFTSIVYFFWWFPFKPPLKNRSRRYSGPTDFWGGGGVII